MQKLYVAITGPGCVGKSTVLSSEEFTTFIKDNNFYMFQERDYENNENDYIKALKKEETFWISQKFFFKTQQDDIENAVLRPENIIFDRHMLDSFIYPEIQIQNNLYSDVEIKQWKKLKSKMLKFLKQKPKLDLLIIVTTSSFNMVEMFRKNAEKSDNRRRLENSWISLYEQYWNAYNTKDSLEFFKRFAKKVVFLYNDGNKKELTEQIIKEIDDLK
ncbi:hypothetical protein [Mycoplasma sp. CR]|uniref:hypothetical protein n=2 Tax=Mycoplasma TaxID=2093 RepID=UPI003AADBF06